MVKAAQAYKFLLQDHQQIPILLVLQVQDQVQQLPDGLQAVAVAVDNPQIAVEVQVVQVQLKELHMQVLEMVEMLAGVMAMMPCRAPDPVAVVALTIRQRPNVSTTT